METEALITARKVPENERNTFLPKMLPHGFIQFEARCFAVMSQQADVYIGGMWDFFELSNGSLYIAPADYPDGFNLDVPTNGYRGHLSSDAAGIVASLLALNALCWAPSPSERVVEQFYGLRDFACGHPEALEILGAID